MDAQHATLTLETLSAADGAAQLWNLATGLDKGSPELIAALLGRAWDFEDPFDTSMTIALAGRLTASEPGAGLRCLRSDEPEEDPATLDALAVQAEHFLWGVGHEAPTVRTACAHALARCGRARMPKRALFGLIGTADDDPDIVSRVTRILATASLRGEAAAWAMFLEDHDSLLVRTAAVAATVVQGEPMTESHHETLVAAIARPEPLPAEWGWRIGATWQTTCDLACRALLAADTWEPELLSFQLRPLARHDARIDAIITRILDRPSLMSQAS